MVPPTPLAVNSHHLPINDSTNTPLDNQGIGRSMPPLIEISSLPPAEKLKLDAQGDSESEWIGGKVIQATSQAAHINEAKHTGQIRCETRVTGVSSTNYNHNSTSSDFSARFYHSESLNEKNQNFYPNFRSRAYSSEYFRDVARIPYGGFHQVSRSRTVSLNGLNEVEKNVCGNIQQGHSLTRAYKSEFRKEDTKFCESKVQFGFLNRKFNCHVGDFKPINPQLSINEVTRVHKGKLNQRFSYEKESVDSSDDGSRNSDERLPNAAHGDELRFSSRSETHHCSQGNYSVNCGLESSRYSERDQHHRNVYHNRYTYYAYNWRFSLVVFRNISQV